MAVPWKRIQQHLEAEAQGREERPVVSRSSLFGIPTAIEGGASAEPAGERFVVKVAGEPEDDRNLCSAVPTWGPSTMTQEQAEAIKSRSQEMSQQADDLFDRFLEVLRAERGNSNLRQVARFMAAYLGDRAIVGDADQYIFHVARASGYDIPAYPLSQSGEVRKFLADEGVPDIKHWYARIGITGADYEGLSRRTCVAVLDATYQWHPFLLKGAYGVFGSKFVPLSGSELIEHGNATALIQVMEGVIEHLG